MKKIHLLSLAALCLSGPVLAQNLISETLTSAQSSDGRYISWQEHIIDDPEVAGFALSGSDGLFMGDIDRDGY
jgi:hypothetical protein